MKPIEFALHFVTLWQGQGQWKWYNMVELNGKKKKW